MSMKDYAFSAHTSTLSLIYIKPSCECHTWYTMREEINDSMLSLSKYTTNALHNNTAFLYVKISTKNNTIIHVTNPYLVLRMHQILKDSMIEVVATKTKSSVMSCLLIFSSCFRCINPSMFTIPLDPTSNVISVVL